MPRGRKPQNDSAAAERKAKREAIAQEIESATAGEGFEVVEEGQGLAEALKLAPYLPMARQLAELGDKAGSSRKAGYVRRQFFTEEALGRFTRGLRAALKSMDYSLTVAGPVQSGGVWLVEYRAKKTRTRAENGQAAEQQPTEQVPYEEVAS